MTDMPTYIFSRVFDAPKALVWKAWSDPKLLAVWYGPGVETVIHEFDLRAGGRWLNEMKWGETSDYSRMEFQEVTQAEKIVWLHHSTDAEWLQSPNPMMPNWPQKLLTTVTFVEDGGQTKVKLEQVPVDASAEEAACFAEMMGGMDSGWGKGFDLLETLL
ncbi:SRPBCC family protein [Shimia sp. NS0008-38b]|uniref:SRPBCC family protein n=1 Tax=Shimia sp. NS0008-38b TaxID=3127653 RepID=UPI0031082B5B